MKQLPAGLAAIIQRIDRDFLLWGVVPALVAALITGLFVVPNYMRAGSLRDEAQLLQAVTNENIARKSNLERLEASISQLRDLRSVRCRPLCAGIDHDRLPNVITRPNDKGGVRDQSIRTGQILPAEDLGTELRVAHREVTVEMTASFESIFSVIDSADSIDQLVTVKSLDIYATTLAPEQALQGNPTVHAIIVFDEWFDAAAARPDAKADRKEAPTGAPGASAARPGVPAPAANGGTGAYEAKAPEPAAPNETAKPGAGR